MRTARRWKRWRESKRWLLIFIRSYWGWVRCILMKQKLMHRNTLQAWRKRYEMKKLGLYLIWRTTMLEGLMDFWVLQICLASSGKGCGSSYKVRANGYTVRAMVILSLSFITRYCALVLTIQFFNPYKGTIGLSCTKVDVWI